MKQGSAHDISAAKREPISHKVNEDATSQIGVSTIYKKSKLEEGRGFTAPKDKGSSCHKSGSQGRH